MMLRSFLPRLEQRYVFVGSAVGVLLPVSFYSLAAWNGSAGSFVSWALANPSQATLTAMPFWMGLVALQFGRSKRLRLKEAASRRLRERRLFHSATHDVLTGLGNRAALQRAGKAAQLSGGRWGVLLIDMDKFKFINDTLGHHAGDELLKTFAARLKTLESAAICAFRLGGDEFVILHRDLDGGQGLTSIAEKIEAFLAEPFILAGGAVDVGASIGMAEADRQDDTLETVMQRADLALYSAKDEPGTAHALYDETLAHASLARIEMERDLVHAVDRNEFTLEFQPIFGAAKGEVRALEALVRWQHPEKGVISPDRFIPAAERCGKMVKLDNWVLNAACEQAVQWPAPTGVSVNVSRSMFEHDSFLNLVVRCLDTTGLAPSRLTIEISETVITLDPALVRSRLEHLRILGVRVALDDFGLALSSLSSLQGIEVDQLKLDRSFAAGILSGAKGAGLMDVMMQFGSALKVTTAIEGIDDERQMEFVRQRGAAEVQGVLFSQPVPAGEVGEYLRLNAGGVGFAAA